MNKLNKVFESNQVLTAQEMNQITNKIDELVDGINTYEDNIPDTSEFATKEELEGKVDIEDLSSKQDTLISGTNIKTINGNSLLGEGNIEIQGSGSGIADAPSDDKIYGRKNGNWDEIIIPSIDNLATKDEISDILTKTEAGLTYQPIGDYLTSIPDEYITNEELTLKGYATTTELNSKLDTETYNQDKTTFATKEELSEKANTSDLSNYVTTVNAESIYAKKDEIPTEYTLPIASDSVLGGIKVGAGLSINPETGILSTTGGGVADSVDWANITSKPDFKTVATSGSYNDLTDTPTIPTKTSELENDSNYLTSVPEEYVTETELNNKNYATVSQIPSLDGYATQTWVQEQGYLTEHQDISSLATKSEVTESLATKQDSLISGTNIKTINGETILGDGNITIEGGSSGSVDITDIVMRFKGIETGGKCTQEDYNTLKGYVDSGIMTYINYEGTSAFVEISTMSGFLQVIFCIYSYDPTSEDGSMSNYTIFNISSDLTVTSGTMVFPDAYYTSAIAITANLTNYQKKSAYSAITRSDTILTAIGKLEAGIPTKVSGESGTVTQQIDPNKYYVFGECTSLTITLASEISGIYNEYMFSFTSGSTATILGLPSSVRWNGGNTPTIEANKTYIVAIVDNIAVIGGV